MAPNTQSAVRAIVWVGCCALAAAGCSSVRLPAFDPTGERIFAPSPAYTTLVHPDLPQPPSCLPQPAFATPPPPPPCGTPVAPAPVAIAPAPGILGQPAPQQSRLILTPARIVAPVGGEVVLLAGLCDESGFLVKREQIEWMLAPDGVGKIVSVDDVDHQKLDAIFHKTPGKLSGAYAISRASAKEHVITRGTADLTDDVRVRPGQTWISVTSPTPGVTHVTAFAPDAENWDRRKQSATIHWVDAQWVLPPPVTTRAGQPQVLTTTVTRPGGAPLAGWIVRYEMVGGTASLAGAVDNAVEVTTGVDGRGSVELAPLGAQSGVAQVRVEIIRPSVGSGDLARLVVGQGFTTITWSAPGLSVSADGPQIVDTSGAMSYRARISNTGDLPARNTVLSVELPDGVTHLNSNPPAQIFGRRLEWRLGDLAAQTAADINLNCRSEVRGSIHMRFAVQSDDGLAAEDTVATDVFTPALKITIDGPDSVELGGEAHFQVEVTNTGDRPLTNVTIRDTFAAGLTHKQGETSPIQQVLGEIGPGESRPIGLTFIARQAGSQCHEVTVTADGGQTSTARSCVSVTSPAARPGLTVEKTGPAEVQLNTQASFRTTIRNTGNTPLTNIRIVDVYPPQLAPQAASEGYQIVDGQIRWFVPRLDPGMKADFDVNCLAAAASAAARTTVSVTADQTGVQQRETVTRITAAQTGAAPPPDRGAAPPDSTPPATSGSLKVSIRDTAGLASVGRQYAYLIAIENDRDASDKNVVVTVEVPAGLRVNSVRGHTRQDQRLSTERTIVFEPLQELRAREKLNLSYRVEVTPERPGDYVVKVSVTSLREQTAIEAQTETSVLGN